MHFTDPSVGMLGANAIVAAGLPLASGAALACKIQKKDQVALTYFGEGAVNQGVFFETLNLAVIWKLPVIFVCENNRYSEMTPSHQTTSNMETYRRGDSFGMPAVVVDGNDVEAMFSVVEEAVRHARSGGGPTYTGWSSPTHATRWSGRRSGIPWRAPATPCMQTNPTTGRASSDNDPVCGLCCLDAPR